MKNYSNYIFPAVLFFTLFLGGCKKDFLSISPEATLNGNTFFETQSQIDQGIVGAYGALVPYGRVSLWLFGEVRSDNTTIQYNPADRSPFIREYVDQFIGQTTSIVVSDFWSQSYQGIYRCNEVLDNLEQKDIAMPDSSRNQFTGEAKFLRALYYFHLVRQFGGVPLRVNSIKAPAEVKSQGRATAEEVYALITSDLIDAAAKLPARYAAAKAGRATSGAAYTLLAKVYMTNKKFAEALAELRKVTPLGYSLLPNYKDVFDPARKNNVESIFEIQYLGSQPALASNFLYIFAPLNSATVVTGDPANSITPATAASGMNAPTRNMINAYEAGDLRKDISLAEGYLKNGVFFVEPYVKKFNFGFVQAGQTNVNLPMLRYADVLLMIAECLNETSAGNSEAYTLLNQVRSRAGLPAKTAGNAIPALNVTTQQEMRDAIFKERRVELAFENHRWYDLVRSGRAVEIMNAHGIEQKAQFNTIPSTAFMLNPNKLLLLIPQTEVTLDNLVQNPE